LSSKTCFFIGHRDAEPHLLSQLQEVIEQHIVQYGVTDFVVGHYGNFDRMATTALRNAKQQHPHIRLWRLLPYHPAERPTETPAGFDGTYYPEGLDKVPRRPAIISANRITTDNVDYLIAYAWQTASNAADLVKYAQRREKQSKIKVTLLAK